MKITLSKSVRRFLWLAGIFICSLVIASFLPSIFRGLIPLLYPPSAMVDIHVQGPAILWVFYLAIPVFIFLTFLIFSVKEWRHQFSRIFPSRVVLVSGFCLVVFLQILSYLLATYQYLFTFGGWTSYPPLSAMPDEHPTMMPAARIIFNYGPVVLISLQIIVTLFLLLVAYRFGRTRKNTSVLEETINQ